MDVTVKESILSVVDQVKQADGKLDVLVNKYAICVNVVLAVRPFSLS